MIKKNKQKYNFIQKVLNIILPSHNTFSEFHGAFLNKITNLNQKKKQTLTRFFNI